MTNIDPEVPEADALEQSQAVVPDEVPQDLPAPPAPRSGLTRDFEVSEADALDQAREVPLDEDGY